MRLIDADQFISDEDEAFRNTLPKVKDGLDKVVNLGTHLKIEKLINDCPTVDAVSVVHAHWKYHIPTGLFGDCYHWKCSNCNGDINKKHNYCPHCGARMDEKEGK
jgi:NADH pyrophosphatase NudC (nudix superfamily)